MTNEIKQEFDQFSDQKVSASMEEILSVKAAEQFQQDFPDYVRSRWNWNIISAFLSQENVPITRRNLSIAYQYLLSNGMLELKKETATHREVPLTKAEMGIQQMPSGLRLRHDTESLAANPLLREKPERIEELAGNVLAKRQAEDRANRELAGAPGQPVSKDYKTKYIQSLGIHQRSASRTKMTLGEARAKVAADFPDMDTRTQDFSKRVADLING